MFVKFKIMIMLSLFFRTPLAIQTTLIFTTNVQLFHSLQSIIRKYFFQDQLIRGFVNNNLKMFVGDLRGS